VSAEGTDKGPPAQGARVQGSDAVRYRTIAFATVRADEVREGDWVRWPEDSDTMRRITERAVDQPDGNGRIYVSAFSEYDHHEYEWLDSQPVVVVRGAMRGVMP
jgi:hypothetical protein